MEYPVIVERNNGTWRAFIPGLNDLGGQGASRDEAVQNARRAAEEYLSKVEVTTEDLTCRRARDGASRAVAYGRLQRGLDFYRQLASSSVDHSWLASLGEEGEGERRNVIHAEHRFHRLRYKGEFNREPSMRRFFDSPCGERQELPLRG